MRSLSSHSLRRDKRMVVHLNIDIKPANKGKEYVVGITRNFSWEGLSFVSEDLAIHPSDTIVFRIKHPVKEEFTYAVGEVIWKEQIRDRCIAGIKLNAMDSVVKSEILTYARLKMQ